MKEKIILPVTLRTLILFPLVFILVFSSMHMYSHKNGLGLNLFGAVELFTLSGVTIILYIFIRVVMTITQLILESRHRNKPRGKGVKTLFEDDNV